MTTTSHSVARQGRRRASVLLAAVLAATAFAHAPASAQAAYPNRPLRIIVPFSPGGATDTLARIVGQKLTEAWGQPVVIDNKPGAGGNIGAEAGARAAGDGYTLTLAAAGFMAVNPSIYPKLAYDPVKDFAPLTLLVKAPLLLVVNPKMPVHNIAEFMAYAKANPGKVTLGNGGTGTAQHLGGVYMSSEAKVNIVHVPYKGSAPATTDLLGGVVDAQFDNMVTLLPYVKAGKLKALAVSSKQRSAAFPDVPTLSETVLPGFETGTWYGLVAPASTPAPIVAKLSQELQHILAMPDVKERLMALGLDASGTSGAEFGQFIRSEIATYAKIVKTAGVTAQ
ncbi:tripartite tricarboxylate transporter substrate binding protein [Ramlibacter ginsenosidimutans]|uniref:Tripartite tricarboxylate transporter substrate binding protein n=1 Tax=Ramlibacter ginsenosidimutans TaxID=502333 RepID=A0A934TPQ7_9BURK|nr:tripartite tricarboxylate transporter substrate binding protein [Ramlibacter ginsenosidimutans]MBK6004696.1 tripartite tricarboxylate transporter substrate binding protein [Ramlibacter ginsenosidimutans]